MPFRPAPVPGSLSLLLFLSCSFFGSSIIVLIFDLSPPPPLFSTHSRFSLSSSQTCCTFAPRCRYRLLQHLHSPSPQPFYPSASCFMTGYENTGAWYPKQINKKRQKSHSSRLTRMDFPADCWESASELLTQLPPPPCSFLGAWEPARGGTLAQSHASNLFELKSHAFTWVTLLLTPRGKREDAHKKAAMLCFSSLRFPNFSPFFVPLNSCFKERLHAVIWDLAGLLNREAGWEDDSTGKEEKGSDSAEQVYDSKGSPSLKGQAFTMLSLLQMRRGKEITGMIKTGVQTDRTPRAAEKPCCTIPSKSPWPPLTWPL